MRSTLACAAAAVVLFSTAAVAGAGCEPYVEEQPRWQSATLRPSRGALESCDVTEDAYRAVVKAWLAARGPDAPPLDSLALGRAVSYPWLSRAIADAALASPGWQSRAAHARPGRRDAAGQGDVLVPFDAQLWLRLAPSDAQR